MVDMGRNGRRGKEGEKIGDKDGRMSGGAYLTMLRAALYGVTSRTIIEEPTSMQHLDRLLQTAAEYEFTHRYSSSSTYLFVIPELVDKSPR